MEFTIDYNNQQLWYTVHGWIMDKRGDERIKEEEDETALSKFPISSSLLDI